MNPIVERTKEFSNQLESLNFSLDCYIYNPLEYAWAMHEIYLNEFFHQPTKVFFLGMNPGPFGMAQTGIPFGEIETVRSFLQIEAPIGKPIIEHPKRPILGLKTVRREVSGRRLWGLLAERYHTKDAMKGKLTVGNYCPLVFVDRGATGRNITPDKLIKVERMALEAVCDSYLLDVISFLQPEHVVGVGRYAQQKLTKVVDSENGPKVSHILHPSPASPAANRGWAEQATAQLKESEVWG